MEKVQGSKTALKIKNDLISTSEKTVLKALNKIDKSGNHSFILPMLEVYLNAKDPIKKTLRSMLSQLKISKAQDILLDAGLDEKFTSIRSDILSFIWSSGLQPNTRVQDIVEIGMSGDYLQAFECITLIETLEGPHEDGDLMEAHLKMRKFVSENKIDDRLPIASSIIKAISAMENED